MSRSELEQEMSHPVRVLRFITAIYLDMEDVRSLVGGYEMSKGIVKVKVILAVAMFAMQKIKH